jgi:predicted flap endonuclease-1-like 5' DNA nuclease
MKTNLPKMIGAAIFAVSFLLLFSITIVVPTLPPGEIIYVFLGISEVTSPISGISGMVFVNAIINGLFWGVIILIIYGLCSRPEKKKPIQPVWLPSYPLHRLSPSEYVPPKKIVKRPASKANKRRIKSSLDQKITAIEGIGRIYGKRLRKFGVKTIDDLLRAGSTRNGCDILATKVGVSPSTMLKWVYRADLFRIMGIGGQYSSLLESAGVNSVTNLSIRNPELLYKDLMEISRKKNLVRRTPSYNMVKDWIENAKSLGCIVIY